MDYKKFLSYETIISLKKKKAFFESLPDYFIETKSIFVHIPKTAGTAVTDCLYGTKISNHDTWLEHYRRDSVSWDDFFTFAFVRDPVDRFISAFSYLKANGKAPIDEYWNQKYIQKYDSIDKFILQGGLDRALDASVEHFIPQHNFICDRNLNVKVDHVAKFEDLENEIEYLKKKIGIKKPLKKTNATSNKDLSMSQDSIRKIKSVYHDDFELFYEFANE